MLAKYARHEDSIQIPKKPAIGLFGLLFIGAAVVMTIWAWPEVQRTVRIHRM